MNNNTALKNAIIALRIKARAVKCTTTTEMCSLALEALARGDDADGHLADVREVLGM